MSRPPATNVTLSGVKGVTICQRFTLNDWPPARTAVMGMPPSSPSLMYSSIMRAGRMGKPLRWNLTRRSGVHVGNQCWHHAVCRALVPALSPPAMGLVVTITGGCLETYEGGSGYTSAKHAESALAVTLRKELLGEPVRLTEIQPGAGGDGNSRCASRWG